MKQQEETKCKCNEKTCNCNHEDNHGHHKEKKAKCEKEEPNLKETEEKVVAIEQNIDYKDKYLRMLAEVENTKKRIHKEKHETIRFAIENTVSEFLPALDNFENALKFSQTSSEEVKNWAAGFQMILTQFKDVMHNHGIVTFHSEGNLFDPHFHEAMEIVETQLHPDGTILQEYAKGYKSQHRTIRPAKVKVAKAPIESEEKAPSAEKGVEEDKILNENNPK